MGVFSSSADSSLIRSRTFCDFAGVQCSHLQEKSGRAPFVSVMTLLLEKDGLVNQLALVNTFIRRFVAPAVAERARLPGEELESLTSAGARCKLAERIRLLRVVATFDANDVGDVLA